MFSRFVLEIPESPNPLYRLKEELAHTGTPIVDLVSGNVGEHGLGFPQDVLEQALLAALGRSRTYRPDPLGRLEAREAVSEYYRERGIELDPPDLLLTPGTSISYWYCFKLLADPGDEILCPIPSYPLFEYIAALSGVRLVPYRLLESRHWGIDLDHLEAMISTRCRALVLISPHNPTGHVASDGEIQGLAEIAARHGLAVLWDEVFSEFVFERGAIRPMTSAPAPLVFTLNGLSKLSALPGLKLGWIGVSGEAARVRAAVKALELISDTFLPVAELVQAALPHLLRQGRAFRERYRREIETRRDAVLGILAANARLKVIPPGGGFYLTAQLEGLDEEATATSLLRQERLLVHPGYLYDMAPHHLVLSFIQEIPVILSVYPRLSHAIASL